MLKLTSHFIFSFQIRYQFQYLYFISINYPNSFYIIIFIIIYMQEQDYSRCIICGNDHKIGEPCATNITHFYWSYPATEVYLIGSWSKWQNKQQLRKEEKYFQLAVNLVTGVYKYKFLVDGKWMYDQNLPTESDNFGSFNNIIYVAPKTAYLQRADMTQNAEKNQTIVKIVSNLIEQDIKIIGSWDNWSNQIQMKKIRNPLKDCYQSIAQLNLSHGRTYQFKFKINNEYIIDETYPSIKNRFGSLNNWLIVSTSQVIQTPNHPKNIDNYHQYDKNLNTKQWVFQKITIEQFPFYNIYGHSLCNVGDFLYIFGGIAKNTFRNYLIKISANNYSYCQVEEVQPNPRAFHSANVYGNKLLIFGGLNTSILQDYYCFNTYTANWICHQNIKGQFPPIRQKNSCVLYKQLLIFFGGYFCSQDLQFQTLYNDLTVLDIEDMSWKKTHIEGQQPVGRFSHTANIYQQYMIIFGGQYDTIKNKNLNDVWRLNLESSGETLTWENVKIQGKYPEPRHGHTANILYHFLIIFGGMGDNKKLLNDVTILDLKLNQWVYPIVTGDIPKGRYYHAACRVRNDQIIIFGGKTQGGRKNENIYILKPLEVTKILEFDEID